MVRMVGGIDRAIPPDETKPKRPDLGRKSRDKKMKKNSKYVAIVVQVGARHLGLGGASIVSRHTSYSAACKAANRARGDFARINPRGFGWTYLAIDASEMPSASAALVSAEKLHRHADALSGQSNAWELYDHIDALHAEASALETLAENL